MRKKHVGGVCWHISRTALGVHRCLCAMLILGTALFQARGALPASAEFPFEFREGLLWIQVAVSQSQKPPNFLLDIGLGTSVINLATAKRMGLKLGGEVPVFGI